MQRYELYERASRPRPTERETETAILPDDTIDRDVQRALKLNPGFIKTKRLNLIRVFDGRRFSIQGPCIVKYGAEGFIIEGSKNEAFDFDVWDITGFYRLADGYKNSQHSSL